MAQLNQHADVPMGSQNTPKDVMMLSMGHYDPLDKADNFRQCIECPQPYLATTYNFSPEPSCDKYQDAFHVTYLALSADPAVV